MAVASAASAAYSFALLAASCVSKKQKHCVAMKIGLTGFQWSGSVDNWLTGRAFCL